MFYGWQELFLLTLFCHAVFEEKTGNLSSTISNSSSRVGEINNLGVAFFLIRLRVWSETSSPFPVFVFTFWWLYADALHLLKLPPEAY